MKQRILKFQILLFLIAGCIVSSHAQDTTINHATLKDKLIARYLNDTLNAAVKIQELTDSARKAGDRNDNISAIEDYQIALALVPYAGDSSNILTSLYAHFSGLLHNSGAENMATVYAEKALLEKRKATKKATVWKYNLIGRIASSYLTRKQYDSAEIYYREAKKEALATGERLSIAAAENNIGILYEEQNMLDSAYNSFISSVKILSASNSKDSGLLGSINDNIAQNYFARNKFDSAEKYYLQNTILATRLNIPLGIFKSEIGVAYCIISLKNIPEALSYINRAESAMLQNPDHFNLTDHIKLLECYQHYYSATGDLKQVIRHQTEIASIKDSIAKQQKRISEKLLQGLTEAEIMKANRGIQIYSLQLQRNKESLEESRRKTFMSLILALVICLSAVLIITLLTLDFRNRQRIQQSEIKLRKQNEELAKSELERQKLVQEKIERELNYKKGDLQNLGTYLTELKEMQGTISEKLHEIKNQKPEEQKVNITSLLQELNSKIHSQERLQVINESIEQVNMEFHKKLIELYPDLTKSELELCGYFKLNMSNKEIGILKGISQESVKKGRYRLRKKLSLQPGDDIYKTLLEV